MPFFQWNRYWGTPSLRTSSRASDREHRVGESPACPWNRRAWPSQTWKTAPENWTASCVITGHLVVVLRGQEEIRTADHSTYLHEGILEVQKRSVLRAEEDLLDILTGSTVQDARRLRQVKKTGAWLTAQPSTVNGTELGVQEWWDDLFLRYGLEPPDPPQYCDSCNTNFSIWNALDWKWGGLITAGHNDFHDKVAEMAGKYFTPTHVRDDPLIFAGCATKRPKAKPARYKAKSTTPQLDATEQKGDLLLSDLWQNGIDSVHDMRVLNTDTKSHSDKTLEKCLQEAERVNKNI